MTELRSNTVALTEDGINQVPRNKAIVYKIKDQNSHIIYSGIAKRGKVISSLKEHCATGGNPKAGGIKVQIHQKKTIAPAMRAESKFVNEEKPIYNPRKKV
jgi:translation initiation factor 1 (eIF-1/SUI1)